MSHLEGQNEHPKSVQKTGSEGSDRRQILKLGAVAAGLLVMSPLEALAGGHVTRRVNLKRLPGGSKPEVIPKGPIALPEWSYGSSSTAPDTVLMFRGNPSHSFYGTGSVADQLKVVWAHRMLDFKTHLRGRPITWQGTGWTGQAVLYGGTVFIGSVGQNMYALDARSGEVRWRLRGGRMFKSSVCCFENRLYLGNTDNHLRCIDASTGEVVWATNMGADCDSSPCVVDGRLYICGESGHARCLDPRTGRVHWETELGGTGRGTRPGSNGVESSPAVVDGKLYAASYDGFLHCLDSQTGRHLWKVSTGDDTDVSPVVSGDFVYVAAEDRASFLYCFDRTRKGKLVWKFGANKNGYWSTPAVGSDRIYIGGQDHRLYCLRASDGELMWSYKTGGAIWSSPALVGDRVVFGSYDNHIYVLDAASGKLRGRTKLKGRCISTPIVVDGRVYVGTATGWFYCLG